jgi:HAD superfamily phosphatase (TIGR01668 family)
MRSDQSLLTPTLRVAAVTDIHLDTLRELGVKGMIFDLDDTLVEAMEPRAHPEILDWIQAIRQEFKIYIVSNNARHDRVELAALHLDMAFHHAARKPSRRYFRRALQSMELEPAQVAIVGDQLFTDVLGGNRLGAVTILVDPLSPERKWFRKVMRQAENFLLARGRVTYHAPGVVKEPADRVQ